MTLEERVDRLEAYFGSQDEMVRELRDAVTVTAQLEAIQSRRLKEHALELAAHADWLREHESKMKEVDERIANLVSAIGAMISKPN